MRYYSEVGMQKLRAILAIALTAICIKANAAWTNENGGKRYGSPESACKALVPKEASFSFHHLEAPEGRKDFYHCIVKMKEGSHTTMYGSAAEEIEPEPQNAASSESTGSESAAAQPGKTHNEDNDETCEDKFKEQTECFEYESRGMTHKSYDSAYKDLLVKNPGSKPTRKHADAEQCENDGDHWNFYINGKFKGSILGCECCQNAENLGGGPEMKSRFKFSPN